MASFAQGPINEWGERGTATLPSPSSLPPEFRVGHLFSFCVHLGRSRSFFPESLHPYSPAPVLPPPLGHFFHDRFRLFSSLLSRSPVRVGRLVAELGRDREREKEGERQTGTRVNGGGGRTTAATALGLVT